MADSTPNPPLFALGQDEAANAYLTWGFADWEAYISGYRDAARSLAKSFPSPFLVPEWTFFPIAFLYRHCLELQIKALILNLSEFLGLRPQPTLGHDLRKLWHQARGLLLQARFDLNGDNIVRVDKTIDELTQADPSGQSFRYPLDAKGLPTLPGVTTVNIGDFADRLDDLIDTLLGLSEGLHSQIQEQEEEDQEALWLGGY